MNKILLTYLMLSAFFVFSCSKKGDVGPQGEQGAKGEQGIPGKDGSRILSGSDNPNASVGNLGDFYLNLKTGDLFGPKTSAGWGTPYNMKGPNGERGNDGASILNGVIAPTSSQGKVGDFYINTSELTIYGPKKQDGDWGSPVSLKSKDENGVTYFYIYPKFDNLISQDVNSSFEVMTKWYDIPNFDYKTNKDQFIDLSYVVGTRYGTIPTNISTDWKPLYEETILPSSIQISIDNIINDSKLIILKEGFDTNENRRLRFKLTGKVNLNLEKNPLGSANLVILIQIYNRKDGGVIAKDKRSLNRYLRISTE